MSNIKYYINNSFDDIETAEKRENFIIKDNDCNIVFDDMCLRKTKDIAKCREKNIETSKLEKLLAEYRKYAVKFKV